MAITKAKKEDISGKLAEAFKDATSLVFVRFSKLNVADTSATVCGKALKADGIGYYVAKKTLIKRALADKGYTGTLPSLDGEIAVAWSTDDATALSAPAASTSTARSIRARSPSWAACSRACSPTRRR